MIVGIFGALVSVNYFDGGILFFVFFVVGSVFADIDSYNSKIGRNFFSRVLFAFFRHRGIVHSLVFAGFMYFLISFFSSRFAIAFFLGYLVHLILDCFTVRGIRLLWPLKVRFSFIFRSGGIFEAVVFVLFLILDSVLVLNMIL